MTAWGVRREKAALFQWVQVPPGCQRECAGRNAGERRASLEKVDAQADPTTLSGVRAIRLSGSMSGCENGAMAEPLRHRQTNEAANRYVQATATASHSDATRLRHARRRPGRPHHLQHRARDSCAFAFPPERTTGVADPLRMRLLHWGTVGVEVGNLLAEFRGGEPVKDFW
jgi:hypothetical protein